MWEVSLTSSVFFFKRVETPQLQHGCRTVGSSTSSLLFHANVRGHGAANCAWLHPGNKRGARDLSGWAGSSLSEGLVNQPRGQRRGDRHTERRPEPVWALLEGFFASPSLNESNPYEWMGNERPAPEILAFLIMFIINSRTLIISLHSFCLINKWCACTFGLVYTGEREEEREREGDKRSNTALKAQEMENDTNREVVIIICDQATGSTIWSQVATNN